jgi:hypothetical protein
MSKFKNGDKVKIKQIDKLKQTSTVVKPMYIYCDKIAVITDSCDSYGKDYYRINLDNGEWLWFNDMFEDKVVSQHNSNQNCDNTQSKFNKNNIIIDW